AENPAKRFMPQSGRVDWIEYAPHSTRVDTGVAAGNEITPFYDPMISKIIEYGEDRTAALKRLKRTLDHTHVGPLTTNIGMLRALCRHARWCERPVDTEFLERSIDELEPPRMDASTALLAAAFWLADTRRNRHPGASPWALLNGFRLNADPRQQILLELDGEQHLAIIEGTAGQRRIILDDVSLTADGHRSADHTLSLNRAGLTHLVKVREAGDRLYLLADGEEAVVTVLERARRSAAGDALEDRLIAPMPGKIVSVMVKAGDAVRKGQALLVLEAMKMEHTINAPQNGTVLDVRFGPGEQVTDGDLLIELGE
ncbi:MAG: biotin/lipoyl-binding protein, partial [Gammaproteobacteria bacterium]|nr:biotin/lipoyl-binding protein [Gammaproteobacteria bacterium]